MQLGNGRGYLWPGKVCTAEVIGRGAEADGEDFGNGDLRDAGNYVGGGGGIVVDGGRLGGRGWSGAGHLLTWRENPLKGGAIKGLFLQGKGGLSPARKTPP